MLGPPKPRRLDQPIAVLTCINGTGRHTTRAALYIG
jgi:hypothetical protein